MAGRFGGRSAIFVCTVVPLNISDQTLEIPTGSVECASMRYSELAIQAWLNTRFFLRDNEFPVPVVFSQPLDAFHAFTKLWADANNPFKYLLDLKDEHGTPLYEPYPANIRYPLISVSRQTVKFRAYQNYSIHRFRHVN